MLSKTAWEGGVPPAVTAAFCCCCCCLSVDARSTAAFSCCCCCCCCIRDEAKLAAAFCCCIKEEARSTAGLGCCLNDARSMKLLGNPAAVRFPTVAASKTDWFTLGIVTGDERTTLGGDVKAVWVRAGETVDDWAGCETAVVTTELGRWVSGWSLGFSLVGEGVLLRNEASCCFAGIDCWECSSLDVSACPSGDIMSAKSRIVTGVLDLGLSNSRDGLGGFDASSFLATQSEPRDRFAEDDFDAVSFLFSFKSVIIGTIWSVSSGLFTVVLSILVAVAVLTTGFGTDVATVEWITGAAVLILAAWPDCTRFLRADIAGVTVAADNAGVAVVTELLPMLTTSELLLGSTFATGLPPAF